MFFGKKFAESGGRNTQIVFWEKVCRIWRKKHTSQTRNLSNNVHVLGIKCLPQGGQTICANENANFCKNDSTEDLIRQNIFPKIMLPIEPLISTQINTNMVGPV
jgi:hypothetical protein